MRLRTIWINTGGGWDPVSIQKWNAYIPKQRFTVALYNFNQWSISRYWRLCLNQDIFWSDIRPSLDILLLCKSICHLQKFFRKLNLWIILRLWDMDVIKRFKYSSNLEHIFQPKISKHYCFNWFAVLSLVERCEEGRNFIVRLCNGRKLNPFDICNKKF